jgi:hypothetical protein
MSEYLNQLIRSLQAEADEERAGRGSKRRCRKSLRSEPWSAVAEAQAERSTGKLQSFRAMQAQAREVDRRRVEIAVRLAEMEARCGQ